jgi:membrane-bound ClpP family serine protease
MSYDTLAVLLVIIGLALIVAEVFIPSGGMISILCVITFAAAIWCAFKAWYGVSNGYLATFLGSLLVLIPTFVVSAFKFLERSEFGRRVLLSAPTQDEVLPHQDEVQRLAGLVGRRGEALTLMTPGGMVLIDSERLHAVSEGTGVEPGQPIEVIGTRGTRVVVRRVESVWLDDSPSADRGDSRSAQAGASDAAPAPLDFDYPQG